MGAGRIQTAAVAIQFARARYISRTSGGSAVRSAAYNGPEEITAERTGEVFYFRHRDAPEHHEVLLPEGAPERFGRAAELWNAAEAAERRKDAQVAREIVLALPADREATTEDRVAMARSFAQAHFVSKGLAVQLDVHAPHGGEAESERANWHAHLLITTRRVERDGLNVKKARDLDPEVMPHSHVTRHRVDARVKPGRDASNEHGCDAHGAASALSSVCFHVPDLISPSSHASTACKSAASFCTQYAFSSRVNGAATSVAQSCGCRKAW